MAGGGLATSPPPLAFAAVLTVYEKPTCSTCRKLRALLDERGVEYRRVDYIAEPLSAERIEELLTRAGVTPRDALRTRESLGAELGLTDPEVADERLIAAMAEHPQLLQRPIVERGDRAVLARPVELALELV